MKTNHYILGWALLMVGTLPAISQVSNDNEDEVYKIDARARQNDFVPGQVLVKFKDESPMNVSKVRGKFRSTGNNTVDAVLKEFNVESMDKTLPNAQPLKSRRRAKVYNGQIVEERDLSQLYTVKIKSLHRDSTMMLVNKLNELREVEFSEPNFKRYKTDVHIADNYSGNPMVSQQWYLDDYGVKELWNKPIINPARPVIAILDSGVDITHPDLADNIWTNTAEAEGENGYDNDGNGFAGDVHGWDFVNNTGNIRDNDSHGTHVAGIAAASNNGIGIVGANPHALIMPVTVMQSDGSGDVATTVKGIDYAIANGANILNLSIGGWAESKAERLVLEKAYQTAVIVASAGNAGIGIYPKCGDIHYKPFFPAAYSFVLGVQATTSTGELASFSNFDCDGPNYSQITSLQDPDGFNYELSAPGTDILSTIPGGKYAKYSGTSMSAPLVAGAISALKMVKEYDTQEILWGDLLHSSNILEAYNITKRPAELELMKIMLRDRKELADETEEDYSEDNVIDAGETVFIYPVFRTTFGGASNIKMHLEMGNEYEDASVVEIYTDKNNKVDFGFHLDAYGKGVSLNPLKLKVANDVADGRSIMLKVVATCDEMNTVYEYPFKIVVTNMIKISGLIKEDMTLTSDHVYLVNDNIAIMKGVTLTIEPGTRLEFNALKNLASYGKLVAKGTPEKPIVFTGYQESVWYGIQSRQSYEPKDTLSYCIINNAGINSSSPPYMQDCMLKWTSDNVFSESGLSNLEGKRNTIMEGYRLRVANISKNLTHSNIVNNDLTQDFSSISLPGYSQIVNNNYFNNFQDRINGVFMMMAAPDAYEPTIEKSDNPSYLGTGREEIVRPYLYEIGNGDSYNQIDLSNMPDCPYAEAHGIVWKVVVNGKDAQDEYEDLAPLGVGKQKFEIYFNRPMNKAVIPQITFGVRDPWTQNGVTDDGSWNADGTIYTAYKTITGKTKSDGVNRIYVRGAEDNEHFEIPYEKTRFNINIQATGSMATGFLAEAGLGRVNLKWDNSHNDFEDAMGFNIYRYSDSKMKTIPAHYDENGDWIEETQVPDTIRINQSIVDIETTYYTDYDVIPGTTYYYLYRVLSTDLQEYDVSNVVAATPMTSSIGDANGDTKVDVTDVMTTVNYALGMDQKPFIFEAADVNVDQLINVLDVIGIVQIVLHPNAARTRTAEYEAEVVYTIEDGMLYLDTPIALGGFQIQLALDEHYDITPTETLKGFELASTWLTDNDYRLMAYSFGSKTLPVGRHAVLYIGDADITSLCFSDTQGNEIKSKAGNATSIEGLTVKRMMNTEGVFNLNGQKVSGSTKALKHGVYIINGQKIVK